MQPARSDTRTDQPDRARRVLLTRPATLLCGLALVVVAGITLAARESGPFETVGQTEHPWVQECSGVAASRKNAGVYWVQNDSGNEPCLFAVTAEGKTRGVFRVAAENRDWEDVAADAKGNLYIADTGNNDGDRRQVQVYRVAEPDLPADPPAPNQKPGPSRVRPDKTWRLKFADDPFDCEALFVDGSYGYLISKEPKKHKARLFRFPLGGEDGGEIKETLELVTVLPIYEPVTAADLSPDGKRLAVLSDGGLYVFPLENGDLAHLAKAEATFTDTPRDNCEGVCFTSGAILITSEKGKIYRLAERSGR
jgi:hypothetical protein